MWNPLSCRQMHSPFIRTRFCLLIPIAIAAWAGCKKSSTDADYRGSGLRDGSPASDGLSGRADGMFPSEAAVCPTYPATSRGVDGGALWWGWYFHWKGIKDLAGVCRSYGDGAKMVLEVLVPRNPAPLTALPICTGEERTKGGASPCALANAYRFEADCALGELRFELPSRDTFSGFYHVESAQVPAAPRNIVFQDPHCPRDVFVVAGPSASPFPVDASPPTDARDGALVVACDFPMYAEPGCGPGLKPVCSQASVDAPAIAVFYCGCNGRTLMGGVSGPGQPYQFKGCCPGDSGFGPLGGYACPIDGGLPFVMPVGDAAAIDTL